MFDTEYIVTRISFDILQQYSIPGFVCGVTTATTPTLTPTTLVNLEQAFIELQSVPVSSANQDPLTQSGFVPPIVDPVGVSSNEHISSNSAGTANSGASMDRYQYDSDDPEWEPKRPRSSTGSSASSKGSPTYSSSSRQDKKVSVLKCQIKEEKVIFYRTFFLPLFVNIFHFVISSLLILSSCV